MKPLRKVGMKTMNLLRRNEGYKILESDPDGAIAEDNKYRYVMELDVLDYDEIPNQKEA